MMNLALERGLSRAMGEAVLDKIIALRTALNKGFYIYIYIYIYLSRVSSPFLPLSVFSLSGGFSRLISRSTHLFLYLYIALDFLDPRFFGDKRQRNNGLRKQHYPFARLDSALDPARLGRSL